MSKRHLGRVVGGSAYLGLGRVRAGVMLAGLMASLLCLYVRLTILAPLPAGSAAVLVFTPWRGRLLIDWVGPLAGWVIQRKQVPLPELATAAALTASMTLGSETVSLWCATAPAAGACATCGGDLDLAQGAWGDALDLVAPGVRQVSWVAVLAPAGPRGAPAAGLAALSAECAPMTVFVAARQRAGEDPGRVERNLSGPAMSMVGLSPVEGTAALAELGVGAELVNRWGELRLGTDYVRSWAIWAWPHGDIEGHVLAPLLVPRSGCVQAVAIHLWPVPPGAAVRKARHSRAIARTRAATRAQIGSMERLEDSWDHDSAMQREADTLTGKSLWHMSGVVSLRAPSLEALELGGEELATDAIRSNVELRPMSGQQADAWRATLPLGLARWREVA